MVLQQGFFIDLHSKRHVIMTERSKRKDLLHCLCFRPERQSKDLLPPVIPTERSEWRDLMHCLCCRPERQSKDLLL